MFGLFRRVSKRERRRIVTSRIVKVCGVVEGMMVAIFPLYIMVLVLTRPHTSHLHWMLDIPAILYLIWSAKRLGRKMREESVQDALIDEGATPEEAAAVYQRLVDGEEPTSSVEVSVGARA